MKKIGFIINPVAGLGGKAGFKGSDRKESLEKALELGYEKEAEKRAKLCLESVAPEGAAGKETGEKELREKKPRTWTISFSQRAARWAQTFLGSLEFPARLLMVQERNVRVRLPGQVREQSGSLLMNQGQESKKRNNCHVTQVRIQGRVCAFSRKYR